MNSDSDMESEAEIDWLFPKCATAVPCTDLDTTRIGDFTRQRSSRMDMEQSRLRLGYR